ncbi:MAG: DUF169 domain-containing protein [Dehalococcoidales bacterium]|nr:DUF169 domain-containing protein [Dehalococcoidales bacterium]
MAESGQELEKAAASAKLSSTLALEGSPVAVAFMSESPQDLRHWRRKATLCIMVQSARRGAAFYCSGSSIVCGGRAHLGMAPSPVRDLEDFLVRREKLVASKEAAKHLLDLARERAPNLGSYLAFSPLEKAAFTPEVVLFVGTPLQIGRILFLDTFETGEIDTVHGEPLCSGVIAAPITTGKIGISFLDAACRAFGRYKPEEMVVGVPYDRLPRIVASLERSVAGSAKSNFVLRLLPKVINPGGSAAG